ncbi:MAG: hypothetical protein KC736_03875 [Candidatus Moranbacteria bacterium]|nr:hypothetical protein [Candidatus Moranbacteria bacterium]
MDYGESAGDTFGLDDDFVDYRQKYIFLGKPVLIREDGDVSADGELSNTLVATRNFPGVTGSIFAYGSSFSESETQKILDSIDPVDPKKIRF